MDTNPHVLALLAAARNYGRIQVATGPASNAARAAYTAADAADRLLTAAEQRLKAGLGPRAWNEQEVAVLKAAYDKASELETIARKAYSDVEQLYNDAERSLNQAAIALYAAEALT